MTTAAYSFPATPQSGSLWACRMPAQPSTKMLINSYLKDGWNQMQSMCLPTVRCLSLSAVYLKNSFNRCCLVHKCDKTKLCINFDRHLCTHTLGAVCLRVHIARASVPYHISQNYTRQQVHVFYVSQWLLTGLLLHRASS